MMYSRQAYAKRKCFRQAYGSFSLNAIVSLRRKIGITAAAMAILLFQSRQSYG